jgi:hypothetical protein
MHEISRKSSKNFNLNRGKRVFENGTRVLHRLLPLSYPIMVLQNRSLFFFRHTAGTEQKSVRKTPLRNKGPIGVI